jgi:hypothetical protein
MPELPAATRTRLAALGLAERDVGVLMSVDAGRDVGVDGVLGAGAVAYFDAVAAGRDAKLTANWSAVPTSRRKRGVLMDDGLVGSRTSFWVSWRSET